ncbi:hypothetical protein FRC09_000608, partial [Ceratobasidium sp. 395]
MPGDSNQSDDTPLFLRTLRSEVPGLFAEPPVSKLPVGASQHFINTLAEKTKSDGDELYHGGNLQDARDLYMYGAGLRPSDPNVRKATMLNLAAVNLQLNDWYAVLRATSWVLKTDPNSIKALYRAARALAEIACFPEALDCCDRALELEPHNRALQEEHRVAQAEVIKTQLLLLVKAYRHHQLLITPTQNDRLTGPSIPSSLLPYFDPPIPKNPLEATLFCTLSIAYPERCSADSVADFPFNKPILPLLGVLLPGSTPSETRSDSQYNIIFSPNPYLAIMGDPNSIHPTIWDPGYEFLPSNLSLYAATKRKKIIPIEREMSLID